MLPATASSRSSSGGSGRPQPPGALRHELLIGPLLGLLEDASRLPLGTRRDEELYGTDRVGAFAAFTSNIDRDALSFESALDDLCLDP